VGVFPESLKQSFFINSLECIDDLVGKPYESINGIDRITEFPFQAPDADGKRSTIGVCRDPAATD
jgi:hypothetical protein